MMNLSISAYAHSNVGKLRNNNEDNFFLSGITVDSADDITAKHKKTSVLATAVFDGMGGEAAGEKASQIAAIAFGDKINDIISLGFSEDIMTATIELANHRVCNEIKKLGKRMGCTFVSLGFKENKFFVANVGDSRAYLFRNGEINCISKDHTIAQSMVDAGLISFRESEKSKEKHKLTQHIGIFPEEIILEPFFISLEAQENDILLLCSDGLTDMLSAKEIQTILQFHKNPKTTSKTLIKTALEKGGKDNVTVVVAEVSYRFNIFNFPKLKKWFSAL